MTWQIPGAVMTGGVFGAGAVGGSVAGTNTGIITASTPFAIAQEWNNAAVTFIGFKIDITDDASAAASKYLSFSRGGTEEFAIGKGFNPPVSISPVQASVSRGFYCPGASNAMIWQAAGNAVFGYDGGGNMLLTSNISLGWSSGQVLAAGADTMLARKAAKIIEINSGVAGTYPGTALSTGVQTVAQLPAAATAGAGARSMVSDANSVVFNAAAVGGGANIMPVFCNGVGWFIG